MYVYALMLCDKTLCEAHAYWIEMPHVVMVLCKIFYTFRSQFSVAQFDGFQMFDSTWKYPHIFSTPQLTQTCQAPSHLLCAFSVIKCTLIPKRRRSKTRLQYVDGWHLPLQIAATFPMKSSSLLQERYRGLIRFPTYNR